MEITIYVNDETNVDILRYRTLDNIAFERNLTEEEKRERRELRDNLSIRFFHDVIGEHIFRTGPLD
jgi:uncharacterized protein YnzC (UPF0291/DUF896 family)